MCMLGNSCAVQQWTSSQYSLSTASSSFTYVRDIARSCQPWALYALHSLTSALDALCFAPSLDQRTISWQRLLHVKPSEVGFDVTTIEWSPNGLFLALGCDEGEVVVYEIETGEQRKELRALKKLHELQHRHAITAMHWVSVTHDQPSSHTEQQPPQHAAYFDDRARRFLPSAVSDADESHHGATVLATADASGAVVLWWLGSVYLAKLDVRELYKQQEQEQQLLSFETLVVESVRLASDLSRLFVVLRAAPDAAPSGVKTVTERSSTDPAAATRTSASRRQLVALDLSPLRDVRHDVAFVARTMSACHATLNDLALAMRQVASEWKTATRIMELKLSLLGSLYEKYACEDPPQVDMLAVVASGITSPALAQYFAQDIQEMVRVCMYWQVLAALQPRS